MKPFKSLGRQIVGAYLLFTLACCVFFAIVSAVVIEGIEVRLVDDRLKEVAAWAAPRHARGLPVDMPSGMSFHYGASIPISLRMLQQGIQEVTVDGKGLHVLGGRTETGPFVVVDHESDYEKVETAVYSLLGVCFLGFLGLSLLLGRFMARRVVSPIIDLSAAVADRRPELPLTDNNNELGVLARAFETYAKQMKHYLDRERFFTGDVSHELRTPLTIIAGAAEILMTGSARHPELAAPVERIYRAALDASDSVTVLLMLARSPRMIETTKNSMEEISRSEVARYQSLVTSKPVTLRFGSGRDFTVQAPRKLLQAAVGNLIRNACQYTERGSVVVMLVDQRLQVRDTGAGLPAAVHAMLSENDATTRYSGSAGTGLGLALVKRICETMDATLRVRCSSVGETIMEIDFSQALTKI